jgi:bacterioferritin-associated ferredoxin
MIISICRRVSDRDIAREVRAGCPGFDGLQDALRVATACGACRAHARACFDAHAAASDGGGSADGGAVPLALAT